jgi:hypothetical protein
LTQACEKRLEGDLDLYDETLERSLSLLEKIGFSAKAVQALSEVIRRLARVARAARHHQLDTLDPRDQDIIKLKNDPQITVSILASQFVRLVATAHKRLPADVLPSLLQFDLRSHSPTEELRTALSEQVTRTL